MIYNNQDIRKRVKGKGRNKRIRLVLNQFAWLLNNDRESVINAFQDAGFDVGNDATPRRLKNILRRAITRLKDKSGKSPKARRLIRNISILILTQEQEVSEFSNFFNKNKKKTGDDVKDDAKDDAKDGSQKNQFLQDNADTIGQIGASLFQGLFSNKGNDQVESQLGSGANNFPPPAPPVKKSKTGLFIGIGAVALIGIGTAVYFIRKNK